MLNPKFQTLTLANKPKP